MSNLTSKQIYDLTGFASEGEFFLSHYFKELKDAGFIRGYSYEKRTFELSQKKEVPYRVELKTKIKEENRHLLASHSYTPDFFVLWEKKAQGIFIPKMYTDSYQKTVHTIEKGDLKTSYPFPYVNIVKDKTISIIEAKSDISYDFENKKQLFTLNQKWMFDKLSRYVQLIVADDLFEKTFYPRRYQRTIRNNKRIKRKNYIFLEEYLYGRKPDISEFTPTLPM